MSTILTLQQRRNQSEFNVYVVEYGAAEGTRTLLQYANACTYHRASLIHRQYLVVSPPLGYSRTQGVLSHPCGGGELSHPNACTLT